MRQFSNVTNKRCFATWFVALSSLFTSRKRINFIKERGSHVALRIFGTWTNGANGSSDIEGKAVMGSGENGAAGTLVT